MVGLPGLQRLMRPRRSSCNKHLPHPLSGLTTASAAQAGGGALRSGPVHHMHALRESHVKDLTRIYTTRSKQTEPTL